MSVLRVHHILPRTAANGPGWRSALWLQGCTLGCPGCFNPETHHGGGRDMTVAAAFDTLCQGSVEGVTISGGEPLQQVRPLTELLERVRRETALSVVLFTGYPWDVANRHPRLLAAVDILLAGPYDASQRVARGLLGSANKTIHFLTSRYGPQDLAEVPHGEVIIGEDGEMALTGIDPWSA